MKLKKYILIVFVLPFFSFNIYANSVEIFSDIRTKENNLDYTEAIFSPDNQYLVYSFGKSNAYFYNIKEARISFHIDFEKTAIIRKIEFSPNGELLAIITANASEYTDCLMYVYDTKEFDLLYEKRIFYYAPSKDSSLFSSNNEYLIVCQRNFSRKLSDDVLNPQDITLNFLDSRTGTPIKVFSSRLLINNITVSSDNKKILISYGLSTSSSLNWFLWNITGTTIQETEIPQIYSNMLKFTDDSKYIYSENKVWNAENGTYIKSFTSNIAQYIKKVSINEKIAILSDYGYLGFIKIPIKDNFYKEIFLDNVNIYDFEGYERTNNIDTSVLQSAGYLQHSNISNNNEYMCSTCLEDGSVFLSRTNWEPNKKHTEKPICKISVFENDEWIVLSPDGFYNTSPNGDKYVHIRYNLDVYDLKQFTKAYHQPEVLIARAFGKKDPQCVTYYGNILLSSPPPLISAVQNDIIDNCLLVNLRVLNYGNNTVTDVSFFRNGKYLGNSKKEFKNYVISEKIDSIEMNIPIDLENGKNYIEIVANTEICYGIQTIILESDFIGKKESDLYVLSIGINKYMQTEQNPTTSFLPNLIHAVEDSKAMSLVLEEKLSDYKNIHITQINDDVAITPNKENILKSISMFEKMSENDDAIIFIAAHGLTNKGVFYIFPNDYKTAAYSSDIIDYSSAISIEEILSKLTFLGRKIVLLDSCMSGGIQNNYYVKTLQNKSVAILTAAQENELAQENSKSGGLFTQSLISYLNNQNPEDYNLKEMANYIYDEVRNLSRFEKRGRIKQSPYFCIPDGFSNFSFK